VKWFVVDVVVTPGAGRPTSIGAQTWSPMAEISTLFPQLEHLIVGKKPISIVAILVRIKRSGPSKCQEGLMPCPHRGRFVP
jgi:hypothetical protein